MAPVRYPTSSQAIEMKTYAIAVKRDERSRHSLSEAIAEIRGIAGLRITDADDPFIALVDASDDAIRHVKSRINLFCHIEEETPHYPQASR